MGTPRAESLTRKRQIRDQTETRGFVHERESSLIPQDGARIAGVRSKIDAANLVCSARTMMCRESYHEALEVLETVLKLDPDLGLAVYCRGVIMYKLRDYPSALKDLDLVLQHQPTNRQALLHRAYCKLGLGRYRETFEDVDGLLRLRPGDELALKCMERAVQYLKRKGLSM